MLTLCLALQLLFPARGTQDDPTLQLLNDGDPSVRRKAAEICGLKGSAAAVVKLVGLTADENADVKAAAVEALRKITGLTLQDSLGWTAWLTSDEGKKFREAALGQNLGAVWARLDSLDRKVTEDKNDLERRTRDARNEIRYLSAGMTLVGILFMLVMFYFVGHVSSRLKEWKELVTRGEVSIRKGEEITQRTDRIIAELDAKKAEIMTFIGKVRDDNQGELDRYVEMLQKNLEHQVREQVMIYRQKAEKELEQTLAELLKRNRVTT